MPVTAYSTTAANNNGAVPNGAPEGMAPSGVNDVIRQLMADIAVEAQTNNVKVLKSVAGTNTITADMDPELAAYVAGMIVVFTPAATNTGAVTIAIDGLTALDIQKGSGSALTAGDLVIGVPALLVLDSGADDFILMNPQNSGTNGSFTGTLTGMSGSTTGTINYTVADGIAHLWSTSAITGTSGSLDMTMTGLPAAVQPSGARSDICLVTNDSNTCVGRFSNTGSSSTLNFFCGYLDPGGSVTYIAIGSSAFEPSGSKGLPAGWCIRYPL